MQSGATLRPIVVVDDNPDDLFFFKRHLAKAGIVHPLRVAGDGEEAIALLGALAPSTPSPARPLLVFLDLKLPRVSGFSVLEWIRQQPQLDRVPVAVLSSSAEPRDVSRAYRIGAQTYLVKPPPLADLVAVIDAAGKCASAAAARAPSTGSGCRPRRGPRRSRSAGASRPIAAPASYCGADGEAAMLHARNAARQSLAAPGDVIAARLHAPGEADRTLRRR